MIDGYERLDNGVIKQTNPEQYNYDKDYVIDRYDSYGQLPDMMSYLRLGYMLGIIEKPKSVLDVGYGNGSFLKICQNAGIETYGTDVSGYSLEYGKFIDFDNIFKMEFDLITFFDSLEHFTDVSFLSKIKCKYICVSVPHCHYNEMIGVSHKAADNYFLNWKHRRPNEHIWHFDSSSLYNTMKDNGFHMVIYSNLEDIIRKPINGRGNILTAVFEKI